jgi:hypothetical protein
MTTKLSRNVQQLAKYYLDVNVYKSEYTDFLNLSYISLASVSPYFDFF